MTTRRINWFKYAAPQRFHALAGAAVPWFGAAAVLLTLVGLYIGLLRAPTDAQQGEAYRIIFVHVPAAWMSMVVYLAMAFWAGIGLVFNARLASMLANALAPTGALMTLIALWTGALWGKPTWGAWWVWDARLTSELILLFLYLGYMALQSAFEDRRTASRASAVLAIVGAVNVPIIYYSVIWWNTLHQPPSLTMGNSSIEGSMLIPLLLLALAFKLFYLTVLMIRTRCEVLERECNSAWVQELAQESMARTQAAVLGR